MPKKRIDNFDKVPEFFEKEKIKKVDLIDLELTGTFLVLNKTIKFLIKVLPYCDSEYNSFMDDLLISIGIRKSKNKLEDINLSRIVIPATQIQKDNYLKENPDVDIKVLEKAYTEDVERQSRLMLVCSNLSLYLSENSYSDNDKESNLLIELTEIISLSVQRNIEVIKNTPTSILIQILINILIDAHFQIDDAFFFTLKRHR